MIRLLVVAALWSPLAIAACCRPSTVPVTPPPCLTHLSPTPPASSADDATWSHYWVRLAAWAAGVERACGAHLLPAPAVP